MFLQVLNHILGQPDMLLWFFGLGHAHIAITMPHHLSTTIFTKPTTIFIQRGEGFYFLASGTDWRSPGMPVFMA